MPKAFTATVEGLGNRQRCLQRLYLVLAFAIRVRSACAPLWQPPLVFAVVVNAFGICEPSILPSGG